MAKNIIDNIEKISVRKTRARAKPGAAGLKALTSNPARDEIAHSPSRRSQRRTSTDDTASEGVRAPARRRGGRAVTISHDALQDLPLPIYTTDAHGMIDFYNDAAAEFWGVSPALGEHQWFPSCDVFTPDGRPTAHGNSAIATLLTKGYAVQGEEALAERPDGRRVAFKSYPAPLKNPNGTVVGALNMLVDQTERRNAIVATNRLAAIVEGSDDAIMSKTLDGIVTSWNAGAERLFGYTSAEMIGQSITRLIPEELREEEQRIIGALKAGGRIDHFDTVRLAKDGRPIAVSLTVSPIRDAEGHVVGASKIARSAIHRKRAEAALKNATEAAMQARVEAESANQEKTDFLAVMSHEIRTPMTGIAGFIELLADSGDLTPAQLRYLGLVKTANAALLTIVNDILDFSKVEAGRLELDPRPLSISNLIYEAMAITHPAATKKMIVQRYRVDPSVPDWVVGDEARLRQVLLNLLNNAIKFTEAGFVTVETRAQRSADGRERILFSVADTGIGIPSQQHYRLFKSFSQADNSISRSHGGTGLGLAICKRLVDLMNGDIGVISETGQGATIWFTAQLPATSEPTAAKAPEPAFTAAPREKGRILLVDDIDTNLEIVGHYLEDYGYVVEPRDSAAKAIELLRTTPFDLVLMDIQMPVIDGVTATRMIRALDSPINQIPIIALTGNVLPQQISSFLGAGMNGHISKPIERARLYDMVETWLLARKSAPPPTCSTALDFHRAKFDEFVGHFGSAWVEQNGGKFLVMLDESFHATPDLARREAHQLINFAGLLGFDGFVELCRAVEHAPEDGPDQRISRLDEIRIAQTAISRMLREVLLPELRGGHVVGAPGERRTAAAA